MKIDIIHRYFTLPGAVTPIVSASIKQYKKQDIKYNLIYDKKRSRLTFLSSLKFYYYAIKKINKSDGALVLTHSYPICFLKKIIKKPIILVVHNTGWEEYRASKSLKELISAFFRARAFKKADKLFAVSSMVKEILVKNYHVDKNKIVVINNGVDYKLFKPMKRRKTKKFIILQRGTDKRKGFDLLIKWAPKIIENNKNVSFLVLGPKKDIPEKLRHYFRFIEWVNYKDMPGVYNLADLVISPSRYDPFPGVVLEAMSCGRPVLMSNLCGTKELVEDGKNGFVSDLENFDKKILDVIKRKDLDKIGKNARKTIIEKVPWEKVIKKQINEFNKLINSNKQKKGAKMKVSLITTVKNEEKNIEVFIKSIINQTKKPDEFIIVDGGSSDNTYKILKKYSKKYNWIRVYQLNGANISQGRNYAIQKAKNEIIVVVDAGTKYKKNWLENLTKHFVADVGYGKTLPWVENDFQKILAKKMKQRFGSSRNIIFKKSVWKKVGGYPEDLKCAEDTVFNEKIRIAGFKSQLIPNAICYWEMRSSLDDLKKQFYNYGYWDAKAYKKYKILPTKSKILIMFLTPLIILYPVFWLISKFSLSIKIDVVRRFSYLKGFWIGFLEK
jgi:glycosyltransferase involved in cell wall biosynthesis